MISVVRLWETLVQGAKVGSSGYQSASEFNRDLASVQTSLLSLLCPLYAINTQVQELLTPFVKSVTVSLTRPAECAYFLGATINNIPSYEITPVQAPIYASSPIRNPSTTNPVAYHYFVNGNIVYMHSGSLAGTMQYIRYPLAATLVLTPVSDANRDYVVPTASAELEWNENAFNLILYMMQEKLGIELKENLQIEAGKFGITMETQKALQNG
jgi:hypothetical protein